MDTKGCDQLMSNYIFFYDSRFIGVKTAEEAITVVVDYCGPVKTTNMSFCLYTLYYLIKEWPGGPYTVMKITSRVSGDITLMAI